VVRQGKQGKLAFTGPREKREAGILTVLKTQYKGPSARGSVSPTEKEKIALEVRNIYS